MARVVATHIPCPECNVAVTEPEEAGTYLYTRCECDHRDPGAGH